MVAPELESYLLNIVEVVEDILDRHQIRYNHLIVKNVGTKNTIITDTQNVLVKMRGIDKSLEEFSSDVLFTAHNANQGFPLLIPEVVHPFKRGLQGFFSVWQFEDCTILNAQTLTPQQALKAVDELHKIHQSVRYEGLQRKTDDVTERIARHLSSVQFNTLPASTQHKIKNFYEEVAKQAIFLLAPPIIDAVVAHGKAVPSRINVRRSGEVKWSDFETVRLTRKEYDLAALKLSLKTTGLNLSAWESAEARYKDHYSDVNDEFVDTFVGLLICERIFHYASQVSTTERENTLNQFISSCEPLLDKQLPNFLRLPSLSGEHLQ